MIKKAISKLLWGSIRNTLGTSVSGLEIEASLEPPRDERFGELSTNIVLRLAKEMKKAPHAVARDIHKDLEVTLKNSELKESVQKIAVEGAGFINFYYSQKELAAVLVSIHTEGKDFGRPAIEKKKKILLEFVSANPTGPLTVAHGRQAALGDSLARILTFCGHEVTKEYYNNDEGVQIETLGASLRLRVEEIQKGTPVDMPENFYRGEYLIQVARRYVEKYSQSKTVSEESSRQYSDFAANDILSGIKKDLSDFGVSFDHFYSQEVLARSGKVEKTLEELKKKNVVYESEGALWLRSTSFGDDKDRVLIKSDKSYTYLMPDIAYHHEKFGRGFDELVDILGPDHHGYIARLKASQAALGHDAGRIHILIAQLVTLYENGKQVRMSTRAGEFVTLREILDEVGKDAGRFFFLMRKFDAHLDFDLALAKTQTPENPVFYIQYAHARIESIQSTASGDALKDLWKDAQCLARLDSPEELRLLRLLSQYEDAVRGAEKTLEPFRLIPYLQELAAAFHKFYTDHRVISDDKPLTQARLMLVIGIQAVIRSGLELLGVSAPRKM